jgi:xanthine dehydrogenase accessory factor
MSNQLFNHLQQWCPRRDEQKWVVATLFKIDGPSYRSLGAMMLFNDLGEQFGLLSGGCLEADIQIKASKVMTSQIATTICYDANDDDDMSFLLGIGCGGVIHILLQPLSAENNYLDFLAVLETLKSRKSSIFLQNFDYSGQFMEANCVVTGSQRYDLLDTQLGQKKAVLSEVRDQCWLTIRIDPPLHLLIIGGGVDARPLANLSATLGWDVTLCDPRPANARREHFLKVGTILRCQPLRLDEDPLFKHFDAAIIMSHNLKFDADAIMVLQKSNIKYLALLGPSIRRNKVLGLAGIHEKNLDIPVTGPAGLRLGGELPEEIALSILAECQAVINKADGQSLSKRL